MSILYLIMGSVTDINKWTPSWWTEWKKVWYKERNSQYITSRAASRRWHFAYCLFGLFFVTIKKLHLIRFEREKWVVAWSMRPLWEFMAMYHTHWSVQLHRLARILGYSGCHGASEFSYYSVSAANRDAAASWSFWFRHVLFVYN